MTARYVYGVVSAAPAVDVPPSGLGPVHLVRRGALAAVVSEVEETPQGRRRELKAHADVLAALCEATTVVPFAFGTVLRDDDSVSDLLAEHGGHFGAELTRLRDLQQFNLVVEPDEPQLLRDVMAAGPDLQRLKEQVRAQRAGSQATQLRLGELVAQRYRAAAEALGAAVVQALREHLTDVQVEHLPDGATSASLLVARSQVADLLRDAEQVAERVHGRAACRLTGPLAPFTFVAPLPRSGPSAREPAWA